MGCGWILWSVPNWRLGWFRRWSAPNWRNGCEDITCEDWSNSMWMRRNILCLFNLYNFFENIWSRELAPCWFINFIYACSILLSTKANILSTKANILPIVAVVATDISSRYGCSVNWLTKGFNITLIASPSHHAEMDQILHKAPIALSNLVEFWYHCGSEPHALYICSAEEYQNSSVYILGVIYAAENMIKLPKIT